ncbi:fumarylacetoacetase [Dactylosporangium sp. CA-233914]|uniref:fumarylacetoacetase n=1 Tax=Dactylosporangium sp. CA-233914 TaxID=3239934 RepID=UPI003D8E5283
MVRPRGDASAPAGGVVRIGDAVLPLGPLAESGLLPAEARAAAEAGSGDTLNELFALGAGPRRALRAALHDLLVQGSPHQAVVAELLAPVDDIAVLLPASIGDYTDFYVGYHHAMNVGKQFRPDNPLSPNYRWVPIGYHGRASSVRVSGTEVVRPSGQALPQGVSRPVFGPTAKLDYELELGVWIGPSSRLGEPIAIDEAESHIAGFCLLNDWSARDIQSWEYQPLGPFLAKNFGSTVSPWVVTPEALLPYRVPPMQRSSEEPAPLPHLDSPGHRQTGGIDLELEVSITSTRMREARLPPQVLARSSTRHMYWSVAQMVTHHTSNGCDLRSGDLLGTGTLSGPQPGTEGSLLELTHGGSTPVSLPTGEQRTFLEDGDEITMTARARRAGRPSIGFGQCVSRIAPARHTNQKA